MNCGNSLLQQRIEAAPSAPRAARVPVPQGWRMRLYFSFELPGEFYHQTEVVRANFYPIST